MTFLMPSAPERRETRAIPTGAAGDNTLSPGRSGDASSAEGALPALPRFVAELAAAILIVATWLLIFGDGQRDVCVRVGVALVLGGDCP